MRLFKDTPQVELLEAIRRDNPGFKLTDPTALIPTKVADFVGEKNTRITLVGDRAKGYAGTFQMQYNRASLNELMSVNGVQREATFHVAVSPGTVVKLAEYAEAIRAVTGMNIQMSGDYQDITAINITAPARGAKAHGVAGVLSGLGGLVPFSLRFVPGGTLKVAIINDGLNIQQFTPVKSIQPFNPAGNLYWDGADALAVTADSILKTPAIHLYGYDFTDFFMGQSADSAWIPTVNNGRTEWHLLLSLFNSLNDIFVANGLPKYGGGGYLETKVGQWAHTDNITPTQYFASIVEATANHTDPTVNKAFNSVIRLKTSGGMVPTFGSIANGWATFPNINLHFNR